MTKLAAHLTAHQKVLADLLSLEPQFNAFLQCLLQAYDHGGKLLLCGNGGSAADAQHIAAELVGRFKRERSAIAALALTTDTSILTAVANDYHYDEVFSRQVAALAKPKDVLWVLSTSGNSANITAALKQAKVIGCNTVGFLGKDGGQALPLCDHVLLVPAMDTARIQEMHMLLYHAMCDAIDAYVMCAQQHVHIAQ